MAGRCFLLVSWACCSLAARASRASAGHGDLDDVESLLHGSLAPHKPPKRGGARPSEERGRGSPKKQHDARPDAGQLSRGKDDWLRRNATCEAILAAEIRVDRELTESEWHQFGEKAMCNLPHRVSGFGQAIQKVPKAFVERIGELDHTKRRQFNFVGSMDYQHPSRKERRQWIFPFAQTHFRDGDLLRLTDARASQDYEPLGPYDVSLTPRNSGGNESSGSNPYFDTAYFATLASSNFTLCPSGDRGWSVRVWEAAAAGTLCVIRSLDLDVNGNDVLCRMPFKFYTNKSSLQYSQEVADYNYRMFIKYQTFLEGDNVPPDGCNGRIVE
mmetsp:Transcript_14717/g.46305  ORF Transcript_14717/g.46305 Transcript_14717/m.46305 type:complete len:329 (+) Transcript_14717:38-1024(+)